MSLGRYEIRNFSATNLLHDLVERWLSLTLQMLFEPGEGMRKLYIAVKVCVF